MSQKRYTHAVMKADTATPFSEIVSKLKDYGDNGYHVVGCVIDKVGQILWTLEREE
jgi:hypothetical protein